MALRRPIVSNGGRLQQLPAGDRLPGVPALRVILAGGARAYIPLDENGELPVALATGALDALPITGVTHGRA